MLRVAAAGYGREANETNEPRRAHGALSPARVSHRHHGSANHRVSQLAIGTIDVYVIRPLRDGWRVLVLQRALDTRCPTAWETGARPHRAR